MLCPGLRLAAYLPVQAKHRRDPGGRGQNKQKISTEYSPLNPTDWELTSQTYCKTNQFIYSWSKDLNIEIWHIIVWWTAISKVFAMESVKYGW